MSAGPNELKITRTSAGGGGVETITGLTTISANIYNTPVGEILSVSIGTGITLIAIDAFKDCTALTSVTFEGTSNVITINNYAFQNSGLSGTITIPASVTSIGELAFYECSSLTGVVFESGSQLQTIGDDAFYDTGLSGTITIPASVTSIGTWAFSQCSNLTTLVFDSGSQLQTIGVRAFYGTGLSGTITIPASVTSIGERAFYQCSSLTGVVFESGSQIQTIDDGAFRQSGVSGTITIPASVTSIGRYAFWYCSSLTGVVFESGSQLQTIGYNAFQYSGLSSFAAPQSVLTVFGVSEGSGQTVSSKTGVTVTLMVDNISPACFPAGTPVLTDQGEIAIEKIDPKKHTIRGNKIEEVTKSIGIEDFLVCIKKDTLYPNVPSQDTYVTCDHKIFFKDKLYRAGFLEARAHKSGNPDLMNNIYQVPYKGEVLYNVLLKDNKHDYMCVNKMIVETMDPKNVFAKYYCYLKNKKQNEKNNKIEKEYEQYISNCYSLVKKHKRSRLTQK
jgi:S-adenosylmethionine/arginine decarboxylase-like enzyme